MNLDQISKYISLILRHKPEIAGITLDEHGWADVYDLIKGVKHKYPGFSYMTLKRIVNTDEKQRYSFNDTMTKIRANQGHSINVDVELAEVEPPEKLFHGTATKYEKSIDEKGLISKSRLYVHLSGDRETAIKVGIRHGKPIYYTVLAKAMFMDGYQFYRSENGVWLTKEVPAKYLVKHLVL